MKRTRFVVLALAMAVMLLGAGYAYWTETLTISNTVKTGELNFEFQNPQATVSEYADVDSVTVGGGDEKNEINVVLNDMYPGATADLSFTLANTGTMKAKVKNFAAEGDKDNILVNSLYVGGSQVSLADGSSLDDLATTLDGENIELEPTDTTAVSFQIVIDPDATESEVAELLGNGNGNALEFSLTADGLQYNDN